MEAVKASIRNELYANASFLCERLYAEVKNEDVKLLLSECYIGRLMTYLIFILYHRRGQGIQGLRGTQRLHSECESLQVRSHMHQA